MSVTSPSFIIQHTRMNIQAHPGLPPIPSSWSMAAANNPEKAPANDADEKKAAMLINASDGILQHYFYAYRICNHPRG